MSYWFRKLLLKRRIRQLRGYQSRVGWQMLGLQAQMRSPGTDPAARELLRHDYRLLERVVLARAEDLSRALRELEDLRTGVPART